MTIFFLVRNVLSIKVAEAIVFSEFVGEKKFFYSCEADDERYFNEMSSLIGKGGIVMKTITDKAMFNRKFIFLLPFYLIVSRSKIKKILLLNEIEKLFVTYPLHYKQSLYVSVARKLGIEICFFEEGTCFYRGDVSQQYKARTIFGYIKKILLKPLGLVQGYDVEPDKWYSILGLPNIDYLPVNVKYSAIDVDYVDNLFLSRPLSSELPGISIQDHAEGILRFCKELPKGGVLYIKFHPRESKDEVDYILSYLNGHYTTLQLKVNVSAEDVVFNFGSARICGFETSTLVYANKINKEAKVYSVLPVVANMDSSGHLASYLSEYMDKYKHIKFLSN